MTKRIIYILLVSLLVFNFDISEKDKNSEIEQVLKKMNLFYQNKSISMTYDIEYIKLDNSIEKEGRTTFYLQGNNYSSENDKEHILKNSTYYIEIDKVEQTIGIQKIDPSLKYDNQNAFNTSYDGLLKYYKSVNISSNQNQHIITLKDQEKETKFTISKKNFHLMKFEYVLKNDKYYKNVIVNYQNVEEKVFNKNHFSEKKIIKLSKKKLKGLGKYQTFKILNNLNSQR